MATTRQEAVITYPMEGNRRVTFIVRDSIAPDDVVVNRAKAKLLALRTGEPLDTVRISRTVKDLLIKLNTA